MEKSKILLVEDSAYLAESIVDALEMHGFSALVAATGKQGIELALKEHPDLILLDIKLPDISGYEVFRAVREDGTWGEKVAISVLTASESFDEISKNINLPLEYILFKPAQSLGDIVKHIAERTS